MFPLIKDAVTDAVIDSIKLLPFLFAAYLFIEYIERRHSSRMERILAGGGHFGFLSGAVLGLVPQCGFSAMAADLFSSRVITAGTLIAVFLSTSDEAIPLLLANPKMLPSLLKLLAGKLLVAILFGFLIDRVFRRALKCFGGYDGRIESVDCHEHKESDSLLKATCKHTLSIFLFILLFNLLIALLLSLISTDRLTSFLHASGPLQILCAGLIGMIPNCAASVLLTQLYSAGELAFSSLFAGLCTGAGIGPLVLLRTCKNKKQALLVLLLQYAAGTTAGLLVMLFHI